MESMEVDQESQGGFAAAKAGEEAHLKALLEERRGLQALEHQLALLEELTQEQEHLEALEQETLMQDLKPVVGSDADLEEECHAYWQRQVFFGQVWAPSFLWSRHQLTFVHPAVQGSVQTLFTEGQKQL